MERTLIHGVIMERTRGGRCSVAGFADPALPLVGHTPEQASTTGGHALTSFRDQRADLAAHLVVPDNAHRIPAAKYQLVGK